ncbi:MAG: dephospho-CoA kinase [Sphingobacteriales bacterium]|nr:MAG: dephospho-CoA kinase [Sphingobacteriales bacterium]
MLKAGITGGIGSGKSTICQVFETLGISVFYADRAAKFLMEKDPEITARISELFGEDVYTDGELQRERIATLVFREPMLLDRLNNIIHPAVLKFGREWMESRKEPYVLKEAAIFFETGSYKEMDVMIGVYAPEKLRILRAAKRDNVSQDKITNRISFQMNDDEKMSRCDYVIVNDDTEPVLPQVLKIHEELLKRAANGA